MKMKSLLSAAHAAGYAMAPSEDQFHAPDGGAERFVVPPEMIARQAAQRANVPALPSPQGVDAAQSWFKGVLGMVMPGRATA